MKVTQREKKHDGLTLDNPASSLIAVVFCRERAENKVSVLDS